MNSQQNNSNEDVKKKTSEQVIEEIGDFVFFVGTLVAGFYKEYNIKHPNILQIHQVSNISVFKQNIEAYRVPLICARLGEILRFSDQKEKWAQMLFGYYSNFLETGDSKYDAMENTLAIFTLKWDDSNNLPEIDLVDTQIEIPEQNGV